VPAGGATLRIDARNDDPDPGRDMDYIEGFLFTESQATPGQARFSEKATETGATVTPGGSLVIPLTVPLGTVLLSAVADAPGGQDLVLTVRNPLGAVVASSDRTLGPEVAQVLSVVPGTYTLQVVNHGTSAAPTTLYAIPTVDLTLLPRTGPNSASGKIPRLER